MKEFFYSIPDWVWWLLGIMLVIQMFANVFVGRSREKLGAIVALLENIDRNLIKIGNRSGKLESLDMLRSKLDDVERQKHEVKQLKIGDRVCVRDRGGELLGTITRVEKSGESFDVTWDIDGQTNTQWYFDLELFERVKQP